MLIFNGSGAAGESYKYAIHSVRFQKQPTFLYLIILGAVLNYTLLGFTSAVFVLLCLEESVYKANF